MKFYRLTYEAKESIKKRINDDGDRFESLFESMTDELADISQGNLIAFLSDYAPGRMHIAAAVVKGVIEDYLEEIKAFIPPCVSDIPETEEITCIKFDDCIDRARFFDFGGGNNIKEKLGIEILNHAREERDFTESFIESVSQEYYSPDMDDEISRIRQSGRPEINYHPVHYIIGGASRKSRENLLQHLLDELMENGRVTQSRYSTIYIHDSYTFCNTAVLADTFLKINSGGAVVFSIEDKMAAVEDKRSFVADTLEVISKECRKHMKNTLCVFLLPDNSHSSASFVRRLMPDETFVEIQEDSMDGEKSRGYISSLAKRDGVRANKALYKHIKKDNTYFIDELDAFYNDWYKRSVINKSFPAYSDYYEKQEVKTVEEQGEAEGDAYGELMSMTGLSEAKKVINESIDYFKAQKLFANCGFTGAAPSMHMVFTGSPGTAKTTVARLFARIMRDNKILTEGVFVEVGRADLVGKYVGWTAQIVKSVFKKAEGGVLFIDEAYSLVDDKSGLYGDEAINTIVQEMENHRNNTIVIFAGYPDKMEEFLNKNPGLRSRIAFHVPFEDYSPDELFEIAELMSEKNNNVLAQGVREKLIPIFEAASAQADFGNGRFVRNVMEKARMKQASRLVHSGRKRITREQASTLIPDDFEMPVMSAVAETAEKHIGF